MSHDDRARLFGDPTDRLVAEAVWLYRREQGMFPIWEEAVEYTARLGECDEEEAEARLLGAVADDEVRARIRGDGASGVSNGRANRRPHHTPLDGMEHA